MQPITSTQRQQVATLLCIAKSKDAARRAAAEASIMTWIDRAHEAGAPSLAAWMDGPTSTTDAGARINARSVACRGALP